MAESVSAGGALPVDFATAHKQLLADKAIQFHLGAKPEVKLPKPPSELPNWLKAFGSFLDAIAPVLQVLFWAMLAAIVGAIIYYILREFTDVRFPWQKDGVIEDSEGEWAPDTAPAKALLAEADALAAKGLFAEAAHLILLRSFEDIDRRRPDLLKPSSTAREISVAKTMPERARVTFGLIARHVEASLFGGHGLDATHWNECREAYGRFALAGEWQ